MPNIIIKFLFSCIVILCYQCSIVCSQNESEIKPKQLVKDFDSFLSIIDAHPDPYTHISQEDFTAKVEEVRSSLNRPHTVLEFYKKIATVIALMKDGHSSIGFPKNWFEKKRKKNGVFPYKMYLTNENDLYVIKKFNEGKIPVGAKIISINGISVDSFLRKVDPFISYEKTNFRNTVIDGNFEEYLYLAFGNSNNTKMEYFVMDTVSTEIQNMPYKEWKKFQKDDRDEREKKISEGRPYEYKKLQEGIGHIKIYSFSVSNIELFDGFLMKTFKSIKNDSIHFLIIDVRGNFGGAPKVESRLLHYISDRHFKTVAKSNMKVSYPYRNNLLNRYPILRGDRPIILIQKLHSININAILDNPINSYVNEEAFYNEKPIKEKFEFKGDTFLLINRDSYSAASSFASTFQCYQMGTIIGEETGGTKIFRANAIYNELFNSGIYIAMSTTKLFATCFYQEMEGVKPLLEYKPSILEFTNDIDGCLLYTLRLIKKVQKEKAKLSGN